MYSNDSLTRFKIVLLGNCNTGKTSLAIRYVNKKFLNVFSSTIGCSFLAKIVEKDNIRYGLDIWDTAGQERYRTLLPMYYRNADIVLICIDTKETLNQIYEDINYWLSELNKYNDNDLRTIILTATKSDLLNENETKDFIHNLTQKYENIKIIMTSSLLDTGIEELFKKCLETAIINSEGIKTPNTINLIEPDPLNKYIIWGNICNIL